MPLDSTQHVAGVSVLVDGVEIDPKFRELLVEVRVHDSLSLPSYAIVRLSDPLGENVDRQPLQLGKGLEIKAAAIGDRATTTIFKGEVVALEPEFTQDGCMISVRAYDRSHRLQRATKVRTFQQMSASDMVKKICQEAGLAPGTVNPTTVVYEFFQQSAETDRDFIRRFERQYDYEFLVEGQKYHFRTAGAGRGAAVELKWGETLLTFRPRVTAVQQVNSVQVRGWDVKGKAAIAGNGSSPRPSASLGIQRSAVTSKFGRAEVLVADRTVESASEANKVAGSDVGRRAEAFAEAEGTCLGNPKVRAGSKVKIDVGNKMGGTYLVSSATHVYRGAKGYTTSFKIAGRSERGLLDLVHPPERRDWAAHLVIGVVTNVNDPQEMGRVRVKYPALSMQEESGWARICTPAAGNPRGVLMRPHINDEVVVAFENGDARRPLIVGSVFNGKDKPGAELLQEKKGSFAVVSTEKGFVHTKDDLTFKSDKNMIVEVASDETTKVKGNAVHEGRTVKLKAGTSYEIEAGSSMKIKGVSISVEASASLQLKGATVQIESQGPATVKGSVLNLEGTGVVNVTGGLIKLG
jgi:phage protein D/phage baseplate assembly protein gpV